MTPNWIAPIGIGANPRCGDLLWFTRIHRATLRLAFIRRRVNGDAIKQNNIEGG
jgi:hypothetical protein